MEMKLERFENSSITGNGNYKNIYDKCIELQNIVDDDEYIKNIQSV